MPNRSSLTPLAALAGLLVSACVSPEQRVENREDQLSAAGFTVLLANTPERQSMLRTLPPNRFVQRPRGAGVAYVYADPLVCNCLYVGDQQAYGRFRLQAQQRRIADEQLSAAQINEDSWNWGPWGPGI